MTEHFIPDDIFQASPYDQPDAPAILIMTDNKVEDTEFFYPYYRFIEEGFKVDVATPNGGEFKGKHGSGLKETKKISEINSANYALLYIPGGKAPAHLKKIDEALTLVRHFIESGKPIAALCHGPQVLAAAGIIQGKRIACWPDIEKEITEAGGLFLNEAAVVDGLIVTGRWPADLPHHLSATLELLAEHDIITSDGEPFHIAIARAEKTIDNIQN